MQIKRKSFRKEVKPIEAGRLVFVDETGVTTAMTPTYGRALCRRTSDRFGPRLMGVRDGASWPRDWTASVPR